MIGGSHDSAYRYVYAAKGTLEFEDKKGTYFYDSDYLEHSFLSQT